MKFYINRSEEIISLAETTRNEIDSTRKLIREGKLFDAMDKLDDTLYKLSCIIQHLTNLKGAANFDLRTENKTKEYMIDFLKNYIPIYVNLNDEDYINVLEMFLYSANSSTIPSESEQHRFYSSIPDGYLLEYIKGIAEKQLTNQ